MDRDTLVLIIVVVAALLILHYHQHSDPLAQLLYEISKKLDKIIALLEELKQFPVR